MRQHQRSVYRSFVPVFQEYLNKPLPIAQDSATVAPQPFGVWPLSAHYNPIVQAFVARASQLPIVAEVWAKAAIDAVWLVVVTDIDDPGQARRLYELRYSVAQDFPDMPIVFYHADATYMSREHVQAEIPEAAEKVYAR